MPVWCRRAQSLELGRGGDYEVDGPGAAVPAAPGDDLLDLPGAVVGAVVHRDPVEGHAHVLDALLTR
ncbi:hypothetical protein CLM62_03675 [Streptomyces sp. SA15]|nr:hypothetical protein CLM62_03675 [Streptomyces sp. SA15]